MREKRKRISRRLGPRRHTFFVEEWRKAWRWMSVQVAALLAFLATIYEAVPIAKDYVPSKWFNAVMAVGAIGVIIGRLKNQSPKK